MERVKTGEEGSMAGEMENVKDGEMEAGEMKVGQREKGRLYPCGDPAQMAGFFQRGMSASAGRVQEVVSLVVVHPCRASKDHFFCQTR